MARVAAVMVCLWVSMSLLPGQTGGVKGGEEALPPGRFSETHKSLVTPLKSNEAGSLTEQLIQSENTEAVTSATIPRRNYIDEFIFGRMKRDGVPHAPLATDQEFLRRVTLDLTGRIPSPEDVRSFVADQEPAKRDKLIERLLASEAYVDKWAYYFMDLFRANGKMGRGRFLLHYWFKENLGADRPYDELVREIVSASAKSNHTVAASNVIAREHVQGQPQPLSRDDFGMVQQLDTHDELSILYAKTFLGINLSCVSCHDGQAHLEKVNVWLANKTREEFFQNAAFLGRTRYLMYWENANADSGEFLIDDNAPGYDTAGESMIRVPRPGGSNEPAFILTGERLRPGEEPREGLARIITAHPQFARATVNHFWARLMGFGIVEPFDEFDLARQDPANLPEGWTLQPSHPELLKALAEDFRRNGYRLKALLARICQSSAYQLSARFYGEWNDSYTRYYARKFARMLSAEEIHDSIVTATSRPGQFKFGEQTVGMAMKLSGPGGEDEVREFMNTFGQSNRNNPPQPLVGSLLQPLVLMQSPVVNERVLAKDDSRVQRLLDSYPEDSRVVEEMFLATLSRLPSDAEREVGLRALANNRVEGAQNLQWTLLNNVEFIYNY